MKKMMMTTTKKKMTKPKPKLPLAPLLALALVVWLGGLQPPSLQAQNPFKDTSSTLQAGLNVGLLPTAELGVGLTDALSLHLKGTYLPNLFDSPTKIEGWFVAPVLRWWQGGNTSEAERFKGFYIEGGIPFAHFDLHSTKLFNDNRPGRKGWTLGVSLGIGYSYQVSEHLRITPNANFFIATAPQFDYYIDTVDDQGVLTHADTTGPAIPGVMIPLELGVRFDLIH